MLVGRGSSDFSDDPVESGVWEVFVAVDEFCAPDLDCDDAGIVPLAAVDGDVEVVVVGVDRGEVSERVTISSCP